MDLKIWRNVLAYDIQGYAISGFLLSAIILETTRHSGTWIDFRPQANG